MRNFNKFFATLALTGICSVFAIGSKANFSAMASKVWVGIGYVAASGGASPGAGAAIAVIGVGDAMVWGFAVGMVAGPVGGAAAGAIAGL